MARKINPVAFRLGIIKDWKSRWFNLKKYKDYLEEDYLIRSFLNEKLKKASIENVEIVRSHNLLTIIIKSARPGLIIGRGGAGIEGLKEEVISMIRRKNNSMSTTHVKLEIEEIRHPETKAVLIAKNVSDQIEKRFPYKRAVGQQMDRVVQNKEIMGVKIMVKGRLNGAEIARTEQFNKGKVPLQTLRADIDYAYEEAHTTYGTVGVKVWLYKGEVFDQDQNANIQNKNF